MLIVSSPAKTFNLTLESKFKTQQNPKFLEFSNDMAKSLSKLTTSKLSKSLQVSVKLAELNFQRYQNWDYDFKTNIYPAITLFAGDVYQQLSLDFYTPDQIQYAKQYFYILSGMYGLLNSLDMVQPYRLEMKLKNPLNSSQKLADFWKPKVTQYLNQVESKTILNLASQEYFQAIETDSLRAKVLNIEFRQRKNGVSKNLGIYAKKARGKFIDWLILNQITDLQLLTKFQVDGYQITDQDSQTLTFEKDIT